MVPKKLVKFSSPFAKSCLIALGVALIIDATLTIYAANSYPYLIAYVNELYVQDSRPISLAYATIGLGSVLLALSTIWASYKSKTNYVLVHACITGVFLPVTILVYFTSLSARYKVGEFVQDYRQMILEYRINSYHIKSPQRQSSNASSSNIPSSSATTTTPFTTTTLPAHSNTTAANGEMITRTPVKFTSFINIIDSIQWNFACCGVDSPEDWSREWEKFIPASCCDINSQEVAINENWSTLFKIEANQEIHYCSETNARQLGCLAALKDDEKSKFAWLADLIVFLMVMTITNTIVSLLLFGLSKTEDMPYDGDENELAMVGVSMKPRPSQPEITGIRHRPSVIAMGANKEQIASISQAVRFNLSNSPRASISGPSKFSAAARRGSAHV